MAFPLSMLRTTYSMFCATGLSLSYDILLSLVCRPLDRDDRYRLDGPGDDQFPFWVGLVGACATQMAPNPLAGIIADRISRRNVLSTPRH